MFGGANSSCVPKAGVSCLCQPLEQRHQECVKWKELHSILGSFHSILGLQPCSPRGQEGSGMCWKGLC